MRLQKFVAECEIIGFFLCFSRSAQGSAFKGIEKGSEFLSSQERQSVICQLLNSIRAEKNDQATEKLKFREGEAIRKTIYPSCTAPRVGSLYAMKVQAKSHLNRDKIVRGPTAVVFAMVNENMTPYLKPA